MGPNLYWRSTVQCSSTSAEAHTSSRSVPSSTALNIYIDHSFQNRTLRAAATLSFSKFLCVSSQFCDQHHRLLFKILETSKDPNIRSNIVIALGDVAVSFSNIVDENSNELYKGLSDGDLVVKKNTLMVLTHLILNGMIKVKGQLGEMAKCLEDPEPRIADLAKLFFTELSTKDNAIYNNLPDGTSGRLFVKLGSSYCILQSSATFPSGTMPSTKRRSRVPCDTSSRSLKRFVGRVAVAGFVLTPV